MSKRKASSESERRKLSPLLCKGKESVEKRMCVCVCMCVSGCEEIIKMVIFVPDTAAPSHYQN